MKICIVTLFTREIISYGWNTSRQKQEYALRNGYGFVSHHQAIDSTRHPAWSKILALIEVLESCQWDWVFWSDADSIIANEASMEKYLDPYYDLIIANDHLDKINSGNFFIKSSAASLAFLRASYDQVEFINHCWWEQAAFAHLLNTGFPIKTLTGNFDFNSRETSKTTKAFIWHMPGTFHKQRVERFNKIFLGHELKERIDICEMLNKLGAHLQGAFIAARSDLFVRAMLDRCSIQTLHSISSLRHPIKMSRPEWQSDPVNPEHNSLDDLPNSGLILIEVLQDESLDFIYIDTELNESFSAIDLMTCYSKVKAGGIVCGSGYFDRQGKGYLFGTKMVVDEFVRDLELDRLYVTTDQPPSWAIFKKPGRARLKTFMKRIDKIKTLKPLRDFTLDDEKSQLSHLNHDGWLYSAGNSRLVCSLLGALHEELADRPDLQKIVLEVVWMARRMNDTRRNQVDMWSGHFSEAQISDYQKRAREHIENLSKYPLARYQGCGIVIPGGGTRYFPCAWVNIRMLRHLGCTLPIEFWHLGPKEITEEMRALLAPLGVKAVDALEIRKIHPCRILNGWELKPYSIIHSSFEKVIMLDADNVPVVDPTFLFEEPEFHKHGAIFWPDHGRLSNERAIWRICEVEYRSEPEFESGQITLDKRRCWEALQLTMHYNENSDFYYKHIHGDKDTFHLAWRRLGLSYAMPSKGIHSLQGTNCQHDFNGRRIFQHRNYDKWSLDGLNKRVPGFVDEGLCLSFLDELRERWKRPILHTL